MHGSPKRVWATRGLVCGGFQFSNVGGGLTRTTSCVTAATTLRSAFQILACPATNPRWAFRAVVIATEAQTGTYAWYFLGAVVVATKGKRSAQARWFLCAVVITTPFANAVGDAFRGEQVAPKGKVSGDCLRTETDAYRPCNHAYHGTPHL